MGLLEGMERKEFTTEVKKPEEPAKPALPQKSLKFEIEGETKRSVTTGITSVYKVKLQYAGSDNDIVKINANVIASGIQGEGAAEWDVVIDLGHPPLWELTKTGLTNKEFPVEPNELKAINLKITSPRGARYGDTVSVVLNAALLSNPAVADSATTRTTSTQSLLAIKTQIGHERDVADTLSVRAENLGVLCIISPAPLRGYIVVEAMNTDRLAEIVRGIKRARGIVEGEMPFNQIEHYLTPKALVAGIVEGDIVELIAGPFKGEKARVQHIDEPKEEITVELFEALVPIPVTVKGDSVRVLEKDK
jgi:transcriptional antiterminator NusG